jgi:NAD(P)-dependent dehydrogenase (short-subunit alcohol dehydrogenase family)
MMLKSKVVVIYGAGGAVGSAVVRAFAREGAQVFLTGRHRTRVEDVARKLSPLEDTLRRPRSMRSTNKPWTCICSP